MRKLAAWWRSALSECFFSYSQLEKINKKTGFLTEYLIGHNCYLAITVFLCRLWNMYHEVTYFIHVTDLRGTEDLKLSEITS